LRKMIGLKEVSLKDNEYAIQIKPRLLAEVENMPEGLQISNASGSGLLSCAAIYSEPFSQDGQNGGDYLLIVPDEVTAKMQPYYSELVVDLKGSTPADLKGRLDALLDYNEAGTLDETENEGTSENLDDEAFMWDGKLCRGSDNIVVYTATNLIRDNLIPETKFMLSSLIIPLFYIGLVFLCVALTVLSIHQLSDSEKYKRRYDILEKIGLEHTEINKMVLKQLTAYYLCPVLFAIVISGNVILQISKAFIVMTGIQTVTIQYFGISVLLFFGINLVYFLATYVGIKRDLH
ncbi:MAG: ABC transporter permease, partial [Clostridia bacterium]|nr:ABC transporter permease [Clostridia bacterium]